MTGQQYLADLQRLVARDLPAISDTALRARLRRGWPPRRALEVPQGEWSARRSREVRRRERAVLAVLQAAGGLLSRVEIAHQAGCSVHAAWRALDALRGQGLVDRSYAASRSRWWATIRSGGQP